MSNRWIKARTMRLMDFLDRESELQAGLIEIVPTANVNLNLSMRVDHNSESGMKRPRMGRHSSNVSVNR